MSFRAKASTIVLTAAACMLLAPTAMASSHGPVQVTGKQLESALLPVSDFQAGYRVLTETDSGRKLERGSLFNLRTLGCWYFWISIGTEAGFGDTAFATDLVFAKTPPGEIFNQSVYQFASSQAAAAFYGQVNAKYRSCRSVSGPDGSGGTLRQTVHSQSKQRVGGHQATQIIKYIVDSGTPGPSVPIYELWTIDGTDIYVISTTPLPNGLPQPTQSSLTLKLIALVGALR